MMSLMPVARHDEGGVHGWAHVLTSFCDSFVDSPFPSLPRFIASSGLSASTLRLTTFLVSTWTSYIILFVVVLHSELTTQGQVTPVRFNRKENSEESNKARHSNRHQPPCSRALGVVPASHCYQHSLPLVTVRALWRSANK